MPPLKTLVGDEARLGADITDMMVQSLASFVGRYSRHQVMLLECPHSNIPLGSEKICAWLLAHKIMSLIAHPERNRENMRNPDQLYRFVALGWPAAGYSLPAAGEIRQRGQNDGIKAD